MSLRGVSNYQYGWSALFMPMTVFVLVILIMVMSRFLVDATDSSEADLVRAMSLTTTHVQSTW